jgi:peptide/nickel transport system permease protein
MQALFMLFTLAVLLALLVCDFMIAWLDPRSRAKA